MSNLVIDSDGTKRWYNSEDYYHRLEGPAYEGANGHKEWWVNGKCHRLGGPAIEGVDGSKSWWVDDVPVSEEDYQQAVLLYKCKMVLEG